MTVLARKTQQVFGSSAANIGQFGSAQVGTKLLSSDPAVLQALAAWAGGWSSATIGASKFPPIEEMNALQFINSYQLAYMFQEGIAEYDAATTYSQFGIVKQTGTFNLYGSLATNNVGNPLSDGAHWELLCNLATISGGGGTGLLAANNLSDVVSPSASLGNIGGAAKSANLSDLASAITAWHNLGAAESLVASGYQKLPSGLIFQWGMGTTSVGGTVNNYNITFPTAALFIKSQNTISGSASFAMAEFNTSTTQFTLSNSSTTGTVPWFAIGH